MRKTTRVLEQAIDPELKAIDDLLRAAGPKLVAASRRSLKAVEAQTTLLSDKTLGSKRAAARRALAAERREVLGLRAQVKDLPGTTGRAYNAKIMVDTWLNLMAQALRKREQAIGASPAVARRLAREARTLFLRSLNSGVAAGSLLGRGK
jgi:hypothetical protein